VKSKYRAGWFRTKLGGDWVRFHRHCTQVKVFSLSLNETRSFEDRCAAGVILIHVIACSILALFWFGVVEKYVCNVFQCLDLHWVPPMCPVWCDCLQTHNLRLAEAIAYPARSCYISAENSLLSFSVDGQDKKEDRRFSSERRSSLPFCIK
jgi:hypothetical protein